VIDDLDEVLRQLLIRELPIKNGEVDVEFDRLSSALAKPLVYANVMMIDRYLPGIMSVMYGNLAPAEAVTRVEGTTSRAEG